MAQSGAHDHGAPGHMDIQEQKETFSSFIHTTVWVGGLIVQSVALLTLALAIGAGWWSGWVVFVVIGIAAGLFFKMPGVYWAVQVLCWVLLAIGGLIVPAIASAAG